MPHVKGLDITTEHEHDLFVFIEKFAHDEFTAAVIGWENSPTGSGISRAAAVADLMEQVRAYCIANGSAEVLALEPRPAWVYQVPLQFEETRDADGKPVIGDLI